MNQVPVGFIYSLWFLAYLHSRLCTMNYAYSHCWNKPIPPYYWIGYHSDVLVVIIRDIHVRAGRAYILVVAILSTTACRIYMILNIHASIYPQFCGNSGSIILTSDGRAPPSIMVSSVYVEMSDSVL